MRIRWWLASIWICFLLRGWFYASMFPLWEGYDEFAHFGVVRAMATKGMWLVPRDQPGPRDVEESLRLAPIPWEVRGWDVFRSSLTDEAYWGLPPEERRRRESRLRDMPPAWAAEDSTGGISAYEALQPPLYYWLMALVLAALKGCGLLAQVMCLRWIAVAMASLAVPLIFRIASAVTGSGATALGCSAVVAVMPGFATNAARVSNEPLSILLFTLLTCLGLQILDRPPSARSAAALGAVLGLGLLTKAYFLTAVPPVLLLLLYRYRKAWLPTLTACATAAAIAGWWYCRNLATTGTLSGLAETVMLRHKPAAALLPAIFRIPWLRAVDVILVSHLYFCGWSSLTVRSWMYHLFFAIVLVAAVGLLAQLRRPPVAWLAVIYGFFWLGEFYNVFLQYLTKGLAGSMGWYMYAVVACEVTLCAVAFGRRRVWAMTMGAFLFGLLDLYGMHRLAIPYYTGILGHQANGALAGLHAGAFRSVGFAGIFERLAANKPGPISEPLMVALWILYLGGTMVPMAAMAAQLVHSRNVHSQKRTLLDPAPTVPNLFPPKES
jgi:4-amino-4-deoxy-L-arabinose transferase-like glycosyltransferase